MSSRDEYRASPASECLAVAGRMETREARLLLIEMARGVAPVSERRPAHPPRGPAADPVQPIQQQQWQQPECPTRVISATPQSDLPSKPVKVLFAEDEVLVRLMIGDVLQGKRLPGV